MDERIVELVAKAIAQSDERNGAPPYEHRISLGKHAKEHLFDQAKAAIIALEEIGFNQQSTQHD